MEKNEKAKQLVSDATKYFIREKYIYAMMLSDRIVICYSLETDNFFSIIIPDEFFDEIKAKNTANRHVEYYLSLSMDGKKLTIGYTVTESNEHHYDADDIYKTNLPEKFWIADSLADMQEWIKEAATAFSSGLTSSYTSTVNHNVSYPSGYFESGADYPSAMPPTVSYSENDLASNSNIITFYEGNGYSYIHFGFRQYVFSVVEDYRDCTFSLYVGDLFSNLNDLRIYQNTDEFPATDSFRKKLAKGASQEKTRELFDFLPSDTAPVDYAKYYTNGKLDDKKLINRKIELMLSDIISVNIGAITPNDNGHTAYEWNNPEEYAVVLDFLKKQNYTFHDIHGNKYGYWDCKGYWITLNNVRTSIYIGRQQNNNKPFIFIDSSYNAFVSEEEYKKIESYLKPIADRTRQDYLNSPSI